MFEEVILEEFPWYFGEFTLNTYSDIDNVYKGDYKPDFDIVVINAPKAFIRVNYSLDGINEMTEYITIIADNGNSITARELLFKLTNKTFDKLKNCDHRLMECMELEEMKDYIPVYFMCLVN